MKSGFSIDEVRIKGPNMPDAVVNLARGLSLVTGPSDSGKSFIADAINHVFGAQGPLRDVPERETYDRVQVQICAYESGNRFTLERAWNGGGVLLYSVPAVEIEEATTSRFLKENHDLTDDSVSGFLLGLSSLRGKHLRTNATGSKDALSFRNLPTYILVQEERIITKESPVFTGQDTRATKEESLFRCLLTGVDDSAVNTLPEKKVRKGLDAGRNEVLDSLIAAVQERIAASRQTQEELLREVETVEEAITNQASFIQGITGELDQEQDRLKALWSTRQKGEARQEQISTLAERFGLLMTHYDADIARLESTQESGRLLVQLEEGPCPLCGADPQNHKHDGLLKSDDVQQLTEACGAEQSKIEKLKAELGATLQRLAEESEELTEQTRGLAAQIQAAQERISSELEPKARMTKEGFSELLQRRRDAEKALGAFEELRRLQGSRAEFEIKTKQEATKQTFEITPPRVTDELAAIIQDLLKAWNYPSIDRVVFDSATKDIVINGKPRASHGKGYRALTYTAFVLAVMLYCRKKGLPHPGFVLVDSPIVTYRKPDWSDDDLVSAGMVPPFYGYLADLEEDCQVIVIENDEPTDDIKAKATYTHFTRNEHLGRYGFLLKPVRSDV